MNNIEKKQLQINDDFIIFEEKNIKILFSTNKNDKSFSRNTEEGKENLKKFKNEFNLDKFVYLNQIHSDIVIKYNDEDEEVFNKKEGDGIVTKGINSALGIFTADCVPIIVVDSETNVIGAVHSGWKGTYNSIVLNLIKFMLEDYNCDINNLKVYIGPHIKQCCYEVSEELKEKFLAENKVEKEKLFKGRNLSMEEYINKDLINIGINEENIYSLNLCTKCEEEIKLHSHRGSNGGTGRMISVVYIK